MHDRRQEIGEAEGSNEYGAEMEARAVVLCLVEERGELSLGLAAPPLSDHSHQVWPRAPGFQGCVLGGGNHNAT